MAGKRVVPALTVAAMALAGSAANSAEHSRSFYLGIGAGAGHMSPRTTGTTFSVTDNNDAAMHAYIGKDFSPRVAAELSFTDLGAAGLTGGESIDYSVMSASGLYYAWNPSGKSANAERKGLSLFGRLGVGKLENESGAPFQQVNGVHLLFGGGLEFNTRGGLGARAELVSFDQDAQYANLSLQYRFGRGDGLPDLMPIFRKGDSTPATGTDLEPDYGVSIVDVELPVIYFGLDQYLLGDDVDQEIEAVVNQMIADDSMNIALVGHTDSRGSAVYNAALAKKRVVEVARRLVGMGIDLNRIRAFSQGEENPTDLGDTEEAYSSNRRVVILRQ